MLDGRLDVSSELITPQITPHHTGGDAPDLLQESVGIPTVQRACQDEASTRT